MNGKWVQVSTGHRCADNWPDTRGHDEGDVWQCWCGMYWRLRQGGGHSWVGANSRGDIWFGYTAEQYEKL